MLFLPDYPGTVPGQSRHFPEISWNFVYVFEKDAVFFSYSWKLPAYSGAFLLTVDNFSFLLTVGALLLTALASLLTVGAFLLTVGKCV